MDSRFRGNDALLAGIRLPESGDEPKKTPPGDAGRSSYCLFTDQATRKLTAAILPVRPRSSS